jgi:peroxiredoxin
VAAELELEDQAGRRFRLADALAGGAVVLVFYRGDWWPYCNGQLVGLARRAGELAAAGALVAGVSVDAVGENAAMTEKLELPFPLLADPGGDAAIKPLDVWDEKEAIARTAVVVLSPAGEEVYRRVGIDYADRPDEEDVLGAVRRLGLPPRPAPAGVHPHAEPRPSNRAYPRENLFPYFRGVRSGADALVRRGDEQAAGVRAVAERFLDALS